jgi:hypothetical protein
MKAALALLVGWLTFLGLALSSQAEAGKEKGKEVTLKGSMVCGKCTLGVCAKCTNVLQVKEGDKTVDYFIDDAGNKEKYHKAICPAGKKQDATVTGVVSEKDGKKWIKGKVEVK